MNDEELLENIVNQLFNLSPDKWTKEYYKMDGSCEKRTYSTTINDIYDIEVYSIDYRISKGIIPRLQNLMFGQSSYHISIDNGNKRQTFHSNDKKGELSKLYHTIEKKVGKITEEKNTDLLLDLSKELSSPRLRVVK